MLPVPVGLGSIISLLLLYCLKKLTIRKSQDDFYNKIHCKKSMHQCCQPSTYPLADIVYVYLFGHTCYSFLGIANNGPIAFGVYSKCSKELQIAAGNFTCCCFLCLFSECCFLIHYHV
jgi:hypothetical protein